MDIETDIKFVEDSIEKLQNLDDIIKYFLYYYHKSPSPMTLLEKKLNQFDKIISSLPEWCVGKWIESWHEKRQIYRKKYETILAYKLQNNSQYYNLDNIFMEEENNNNQLIQNNNNNNNLVGQLHSIHRNNTNNENQSSQDSVRYSFCIIKFSNFI